MADFVLFADTACDIAPEMLKAWQVECFDLTYMFTDDSVVHTEKDSTIKEFYDQMRSGRVAKTAAVNPDQVRSAFEKALSEGHDVCYLAFDSALSTTYQSALMIGREMQEKYPGRKVAVLDSLCASAGYGLLLSFVKDLRDEGKDLDEIVEYVENNRGKICHWFTVDDLVYLKRGGRVSAAVALIGGMLDIKPVLHVDNEGRLIKVGQVRGRKSSVHALAQHMADTWEGGRVYISNGDCMTDVETLKHAIEQKCGAQVEVVTSVGSVIGAHSGPGTLALFFVGKAR